MRRFIIMGQKIEGELVQGVGPQLDEHAEKPRGLPESVPRLENEPVGTGFMWFFKRRKVENSPQKKAPRMEKAKRLPSTGVITVIEGLSRSVDAMVSYLPIVDSQKRITRHQAIMMVASIPFPDLTALFWNIVRDVGEEGLGAEALYYNLPGFHIEQDQGHRKVQETYDDDYGDEKLNGNGLIGLEVSIRAVY